MVTAEGFIRFLGRSACGLALVLLCAAPVSAQQMFWDVERSVEYATPMVRIAKPGFNETIDLVPAERFRLLREVKQRLEKESGITATLLLTELGMPYPNAYMTGPETRPLIAINLAMLRLMGEDADAMAAVLGHEYAHIALNHRESRKQRAQVLQVAAIVVGAVLARVPMAGTLGEVGAGLVFTGFSREEERDADEKGIAYAAAAGYSAEGGVRAWERMAAQSKEAPVAFFSTHPGLDERVEAMRTRAAKYAATPRAVAADAQAAPAAKDPNPAAAISLEELQDLERRGEKDQRNAGIWHSIAGHYAAFGDVAAARRAFQHVVDLDPANLDALESLGALHAKAGEKDRAGEIWHALLKADAKRAEAYFATHILP